VLMLLGPTSSAITLPPRESDAFFLAMDLLYFRLYSYIAKGLGSG